MISKKDISRVGYFSAFTPKQSQEKAADTRLSDGIKSQFSSTQKYKGTSGSSAFICMDARRKYIYNEK